MHLVFVFFALLMGQSLVFADMLCNTEVTAANLRLVQYQDFVNTTGEISEYGEIVLSLPPVINASQITYRKSMPGENLGPSENEFETVSLERTNIAKLKVSKLVALLMKTLAERMPLSLVIATLDLKLTFPSGESCSIRLSTEATANTLVNVQTVGITIMKSQIDVKSMQAIYELYQENPPYNNFSKDFEMVKKTFEIILKTPTPKVLDLMKETGFSKKQILDFALDGVKKDKTYALIWRSAGLDYLASYTLNGMSNQNKYGKSTALRVRDIVWDFDPNKTGYTKMTAVWADGKETVTFEKIK